MHPENLLEVGTVPFECYIGGVTRIMLGLLRNMKRKMMVVEAFVLFFSMSISEHINGLASTIEFKCSKKKTRQTPQQPSFYSSYSSANKTSFL